MLLIGLFVIGGLILFSDSKFSKLGIGVIAIAVILMMFQGGYKDVDKLGLKSINQGGVNWMKTSGYGMAFDGKSNDVRDAIRPEYNVSDQYRGIEKGDVCVIKNSEYRANMIFVAAVSDFRELSFLGMSGENERPVLVFKELFRLRDKYYVIDMNTNSEIEKGWF
jgi:hypothetical protein